MAAALLRPFPGVDGGLTANSVGTLSARFSRCESQFCQQWPLRLPRPSVGNLDEQLSRLGLRYRAGGRSVNTRATLASAITRSSCH